MWPGGVVEIAGGKAQGPTIRELLHRRSNGATYLNIDIITTADFPTFILQPER
jgi:hypothetical protein